MAITIIGTAMVLLGLLFAIRPEPPFGGDVAQPSGATHFAEIDENGLVLRVIVADQAFIESGAVGDPARWMATEYDGSKRGNYAGVGYRYDRGKDAFIPPKPWPDSVLDASNRWYVPGKTPQK